MLTRYRVSHQQHCQWVIATEKVFSLQPQMFRHSSIYKSVEVDGVESVMRDTVQLRSTEATKLQWPYFWFLLAFIFRTTLILQTLAKNAMKNKKWVCENMIVWCELLVPQLQNTLMKAEEATAMRCCRVASYLYLYAAQLIYKPPSECNFNRSAFVRLCKLLLQNVASFCLVGDSFLLF